MPLPQSQMRIQHQRQLSDCGYLTVTTSSKPLTMISSPSLSLVVGRAHLHQLLQMSQACASRYRTSRAPNSRILKRTIISWHQSLLTDHLSAAVEHRILRVSNAPARQLKALICQNIEALMPLRLNVIEICKECVSLVGFCTHMKVLHYTCLPKFDCHLRHRLLSDSQTVCFCVCCVLCKTGKSSTTL
jgi:hypothetical protein